GREQGGYGRGSLRITDVGYFNLAVFAAMATAGEYFLSGLQCGVAVAAGEWVDLLPWLSRQAGRFIDRMVVLGKDQRLPCRLIAWRLPVEQANRRRQKLRRDHRDKYGTAPSAERLAWC